MRQHFPVKIKISPVASKGNHLTKLIQKYEKKD